MRPLLLAAAVALAQPALAVEVGSSDDAFSVDVHGFVSQGFIRSTANNYLADSRNGSFEMTEVGLNFNKQLTDKGIELVLTPAAEAALVDKGYDPQYGARQLRRTIQKHIEDPLAEAIVRGQVPESARIDVDLVGGQFVFREAQAADAPLELAEH